MEAMLAMAAMIEMQKILFGYEMKKELR